MLQHHTEPHDVSRVLRISVAMLADDVSGVEAALADIATDERGYAACAALLAACEQVARLAAHRLGADATIDTLRATIADCVAAAEYRQDG